MAGAGDAGRVQGGRCARPPHQPHAHLAAGALGARLPVQALSAPRQEVPLHLGASLRFPGHLSRNYALRHTIQRELLSRRLLS